MKKSNSLIRVLKLTLISAGIVLIILQINKWAKVSDTFLLQSIEVNGNRLLKTEVLLNQFVLDYDSKVPNINLSEIQYAIEKHPYIKAALVSRRLPSSLQIDIIERNPVAYLSQTGKPLFALDRSGVLLPLLAGVSLGSLPVITGVENFAEQIGEPINSERIMKAIALLQSNQQIDPAYYQNLSEVHFDAKKGYVLYFNDGRFPVIFGRENFAERAEKSFIFINKIKSENKYNELAYVDLRFKDQVVAKF